MALLGVALLWGQQEEDITGAIEKYRAVLALASQKLEDLDLPEALARFTEVIDAWNSGKLSSTMPLTRQIVGQAYEGRARTYANLGRNSEAEADYDALIKFDVSWPIDRTRTSPKIVAIYDKVRKRIVGTLNISSEPPGAMVSINGSPIGRTPIFDHETSAGPYDMKIEMEGFDPIQEKVVVAGGARLERSLRLVPNARDLLVTTTPAGAKVSLDGKEAGATFGAAGAEYAEMASRLGVSLADISAPLQVGHVSPGTHLLKIEKDCYEQQALSITVTIDPNDLLPVRYEPIKLSPSLGGMMLDSSPTGAEAILDGKPVGKTPLRLDGICSGRHDVTLRVPSVGQWTGHSEVVKGQRAAVTGKLRMTLAYVGMTVAGPGGQAPAGEQELGDLLGQLKSVNVLGPGAGLPEALLARKRPSADADLSAAYLSSVATATGADLILAARPGEGAFGRSVELTLVGGAAPLSTLRDRATIALDDKTQTKEFLQRFDTLATLTAPWIGLQAIELHRVMNPTVYRVQPGGSGAKAGVRIGETIVSLGGRPIATPRDLSAALATLHEGAQASMSLQGAGAPARQVNIIVGTTPVMLSPDAPGGFSSRLAAELSFRARLEEALGHPGSDERNAALLSLAVLLMKNGMYEAALGEALERLSLAPGAGISAGTVSYLKGLCLQRLNRIPEARQQLTAASTQLDATLWSHDGPPVAERARRLLQAP
ncbi:MAG TPA: PEGA domain-containing protein [Patescibacteria group bacterium]|nr:PEGA domain-containing protein [Patescibacteria group bacterium]